MGVALKGKFEIPTHFWPKKNHLWLGVRLQFLSLHGKADYLLI